MNYTTQREKAYDMQKEGLTTNAIAKELKISLEDAIYLIYGGSTRLEFKGSSSSLEESASVGKPTLHNKKH